jgi:hypothetical protein
MTGECDTCDYWYYWDSGESECAQCKFKSDYFFECAGCEGVEANGLSDCSVCIDNYAITYDKNVYDLDDPTSVTTESVTECHSLCPAYYAPVFSVYEDSNNHLEVSICEDQSIEGTDTCYRVRRDDGAGNLECLDC